jgi:hypothetical protein
VTTKRPASNTPQAEGANQAKPPDVAGLKKEERVDRVAPDTGLRKTDKGN